MLSILRRRIKQPLNRTICSRWGPGVVVLVHALGIGKAGVFGFAEKDEIDLQTKRQWQLPHSLAQ